MFKLSSPSAFYPVFFLTKFPHYAKEFALLNALILVICAPISSVVSGYISDKYGQGKTSMVNSQIIIAGNLIAFPALACSLFLGNFWMAIGALAIKTLFGEGWRSPSIALISKSTDSNKFGKVLATGQFYQDIAEAVSITVFGLLFKFLKCGENHSSLAGILFVFSAIRYVGSSIAYFKAGKNLKYV